MFKPLHYGFVKPGNSPRGFYFSPEEGGAGGSGEEEQQEEQQEEEYVPDEKAKKYFDKMLADALAKTSAETADRTRKEIEAENKKKADDAKRKAAKDKADKDGDIAEQTRLLEEERKTIETERLNLENERKNIELNNLKNKVGAKFKLNSLLTSRLQGSTEEELTADAKELAKTMKVDGPDTEGGNRSTGTPEKQKQSAEVHARKFTSMF